MSVVSDLHVNVIALCHNEHGNDLIDLNVYIDIIVDY